MGRPPHGGSDSEFRHAQASREAAAKINMRRQAVVDAPRPGSSRASSAAAPPPSRAPRSAQTEFITRSLAAGAVIEQQTAALTSAGPSSAHARYAGLPLGRPASGGDAGASATAAAQQFSAAAAAEEARGSASAPPLPRSASAWWPRTAGA